MGVACDFCNTNESEINEYYYKTFSGYGLIKVCLCADCAEKEKENIKATTERGQIVWMPEST